MLLTVSAFPNKMVQTTHLFKNLLLLLIGASPAIGQTRQCTHHKDLCVAITTVSQHSPTFKFALKNYLKMYKFGPNQLLDQIALCIYADTVSEFVPFGKLKNLAEISAKVDSISAPFSQIGDVNAGLECCANAFSRFGRYTIPDLTILLDFPTQIPNTGLAQAIRRATQMKKTGHISMLASKPLSATQSEVEKLVSSASDLVLFDNIAVLQTDSESNTFPVAFNSLCPGFVNPCDSCQTTRAQCYLPGPDCWEYWECESIYPPPALPSDPRIPRLRTTPGHTFWDNTLITAQHISALATKCQNDRCKSLKVGDRYGRFDQCRTYMMCEVDKSTSPHIGCCPMGQRFDDLRNACVTDSSCRDFCTPSVKSPSKPRCDPHLDISAAGGVAQDRSSNNFGVIARDLVKIGGGEFAIGKPSINIWGFAGNDLADKFAIYMRIRPSSRWRPGEAIVSDSGCSDEEETYSVVLDSTLDKNLGVSAKVVLNKGKQVLTLGPVQPNVAQKSFFDVVMEYNGYQLAMLVGSNRVHKSGVGKIGNKRQSCHMNIGGPEKKHRQFSGEIEKVVVYKCLMDNLEDYIKASQLTGNGNYQG